MWNIKEQVLNAAKGLGVCVGELSPEDRGAIRETVLQRFTVGLAHWPTWIWEHFPERATAASPEGWRWIASFSPSSQVVMCFLPQDEEAMLLFLNGKDAAAVLADCFGFEVYFTNPAVDFFLAHKHHDSVIACGTAMDWLNAHAQELSQR